MKYSVRIDPLITDRREVLFQVIYDCYGNTSLSAFDKETWNESKSQNPLKIAGTKQLMSVNFLKYCNNDLLNLRNYFVLPPLLNQIITIFEVGTSKTKMPQTWIFWEANLIDNLIGLEMTISN